VRRMRKVIISGILFLAMQSSLFSAEPLKKREDPAAPPEFTLSGLGGEKISLSDFKGKPLILFFWTTWCPYCRKELKQLNDMEAELSGNGVGIAAVNVDEPADKVKNFIKNYNLDFSVLLDTDGEVAQSFGIMGVPTYIFIDKENRIVFTNHFFPREEYKKLIAK